MIEVPPPARDADMLQQFARIGVGPGLEVEAQDASTEKRGLARAALDGKKIIAEAFTDGDLQKGFGQRLELSAPGDGKAEPEPGLEILLRDADARGLHRQRSGRGDDSNVSVDGDGKPLDRQDPLRHSFRQGRRTEGQGVLVGDDVQSQTDPCCQSD